MSAEQPVSVTRARQLLAALVALGAVVTVLIVVLHDQLIRSWAEGRPDMRRVLRTEGLDAVKNGEVHVPAFVPVALVLFVVVAGLIWVLTAFLRGGYNWARIALTLTLFFRRRHHRRAPGTPRKCCRSCRSRSGGRGVLPVAQGHHCLPERTWAAPEPAPRLTTV
jgi:hypothetical protein